MIAIEQLQTRLQKGKLLLSAYNDQSGSDMVCHGVANAVVQMATERKWKRINDNAGSAHGEYDDNIENDKSTSSSPSSILSVPPNPAFTDKLSAAILTVEPEIPLSSSIFMVLNAF